MSVVTTNMGLIQPTIGTDTGLTWEQSFNANAATVDQHNHSSGYGVQINPNGLNINSNLPFNGYQATLMGSVIFQNQTSLATLNALYTVSGELWYNDAAGAVQITSGGVVNATSSGIVSGSASAAFSSSVLVVLAAANTPANIKVGSVLIGNNTAASKFLTLAPPAAMAADYTLTLPSIPVSTKFITMDSSGNFGQATGVSGAQITSATLTGSQMVTGTVTGTQIASNVNLAGLLPLVVSKSMVVANTNDSAGLAIVRGVIQISFNSSNVATAAAVTAGSTGFTIGAPSNVGTLMYITVTFATSVFVDLATVTCSLANISNLGPASLVILNGAPTTGAFTAQIFNSTTGSSGTLQLSFIAIGIRSI